jgi:hypothetical protein
MLRITASLSYSLRPGQGSGWCCQPGAIGHGFPGLAVAPQGAHDDGVEALATLGPVAPELHRTGAGPAR